MRKPRLWLLLALGLASAPALADFAGRFVRIVTTTDQGVPLNGAQPTLATHGKSLTATDWLDHVSGYYATHAWCEYETNGSGFTSGGSRYWSQTTAADGGFSVAPGLDQTFTGLDGGQKRISTNAIRLANGETRIYCQPIGMVETGTGVDGGLRRTYGLRFEHN